MSALLKANLLDFGELSGCVRSSLNQEIEGLWPIGNKKQRSSLSSPVGIEMNLKEVHFSQVSNEIATTANTFMPTLGDPR